MTPGKIDMNDRETHRDMVRWFHPSVLLDSARRAIVSALFGEYADRRLIQAALDPAPEAELVQRYNCNELFQPDENGAIWIDYVADLGDGFDSTYAIAYLLAQKSLHVDGASLPRGRALIMGGDQVYPTATRAEYKNRLKRPYQYAFPNSGKDNADHPALFMIPGNHDWYDGLTLFLSMFCRGYPTPFGSWRTQQHRSYFSLQLPDNWWLWGIDVQLTEDIDQPQANYFISVARHMPPNPKIILCTAIPAWLSAEEVPWNVEMQEKYARSLDYIAANIIGGECRNARIMAVLAGDLHHYSRYSSAQTGTQFITSGGGGAFLHPTHHLKDTLVANFARQQHTLSLKTTPDKNHTPSEKAACYPSRGTSRKLALGNWKFPILNPDFGVVYGVGYWLISLILSAAWKGHDVFWGMLQSPAWWVTAIVLFAFFSAYAEGKNKHQKRLLGGIIATLHMLWVMALMVIVPPIVHDITSALPVSHSAEPVVSFALNAIGMIAGGFGGGAILGLYFLITSFLFGLHPNDAFSGLRIKGYKHFLRMRLKGDELTVYPIGLKDIPKRQDWQENPNAITGNQNEPSVIPQTPLKPELVEKPVSIHMAEVAAQQE